jgi:hypothetical protein
MPTFRPTALYAVILTSLLVAAGCAAYGPQSLAPGTPAADVKRLLGEPTGEYTSPDAGRRLEYARGPLGKHTWMLDFDAKGGLVKATQVLTESRFNRVLAGTTKEQLLFDLGRPSDQAKVGLERQIVWSYRYDSPFCQWFRVGIDDSGRVADTGYYLDPMCEPMHGLLDRFSRSH